MACEFRLLDFNYSWQSATGLSASSVDPSFPLSNIKNYSRSYPFRTAVGDTEDQYVVLDLKTAEEIDTFAIVFDPLVGCKYNSGVQVYLEGSATNSWASPGYSQAIDFDETHQVYSLFLQTAQEYRYWRVSISDPGNAYGYIEIPKICLGKSTQLVRCPDIAFTTGFIDRSTTRTTDYGHAFSDTNSLLRSLDVSFNLLDTSDLVTLKNTFDLVGKTTPMLISLDSTEELFDKDLFLIYGRIDTDIRGKHKVRGLFDSGLSITEVI